MSALTSLLVRDRIVPISKIEEALQSQVLSGADIDTVLLEMDLVPEDVLSAYRAALFGLLPASRDEVMRATRDAVSRVPRDVARAQNIVPLLLDGRALVVAAIEPLSLEETRRLRDQLGYEVSARIVTRPRLLAGLAHHYGVELAPRTRRLVDTLRRRQPGIIPYVRPPSPSLMPATYKADKAETDELDAHDGLELPPLVPVMATIAIPDGLGLSEPGISLLPRAELPAPVVTHHPEVEGPATVEPEPESAPPPAEAAARAIADNLLSGLEVGRATTLPPSNLSGHIARATRGPISVEHAVQLLGQASHRDDALYVLLRYAQQFFDFVGIFSVGKEGARGRLAHGSGLSQELMEHVLLPLDGAGLFARAARDRRALVGDLNSTDEERAAAALLGRPSGRPVLVVPILLRGRSVLLVHADRDVEGIALEDAESINAVAGPLKDALQRIILQNKTLGRRSSRPVLSDARAAQPAVAETATPIGSPEPDERLREPAPFPEQPGNIDSAGDSQSQDEAPSELADALKASGDSGMIAAVGSFGAESAPSDDGPQEELTAVDLESVSGPGHYRRSEPSALLDPDDSEPAQSLGGGAETSSARDTSLSTLPGVPRSAPLPPRRESLPAGSSVGAYRYVTGAGMVAEKVRKRDVARSVSTAPQSVPQSAPPAKLPPRAPDNELSARPPSPVSKVPVKRLCLVSPEGNQPSVIIDMGDQVSFLVEALMQAPRSDEPPQIAELVRLGESALPVLIQHFPGPVWVEKASLDRAALRAGRIPRGRDVSAVARALCAFGDKAAPYLAGQLASGDDEVSFYALLVAGEIVHPDLLDAVARRMLHGDPVLRHVALDVLRRYARLPQFATVLRALSDLSERPGKDPRRQLLALEALGALRDARSLQTLVARLNDSSEPIVQLAHKALVDLTAQDFGTVAKRWDSWAEQVGAQHRIEWLIDSLMHADSSIRGLASDELKRETQQYFGYHPGLPRRDRELAQRKYREWWQNEGKANFVT